MKEGTTSTLSPLFLRITHKFKVVWRRIFAFSYPYTHAGGGEGGEEEGSRGCVCVCVCVVPPEPYGTPATTVVRGVLRMPSSCPFDHCFSSVSRQPGFYNWLGS